MKVLLLITIIFISGCVETEISTPIDVTPIATEYSTPIFVKDNTPTPIKDNTPTPTAVPEIVVETKSDCIGKYYTHSPVNLDDLDSISPLGNSNPPDHTTPTEHTYLHIFTQGVTTDTIPLFSPGDITITRISPKNDFLASGRNEYSISFTLCEYVYGYYNHVKGLSDDLLEAVSKAECESWNGNTGENCERRMNYDVIGGQIIGEVGHLQGNFDFGTYDYREEHDFVNKERFGSKRDGTWAPAVYKVCPYDYFEEPLKSQLYAKLTAENDCGFVMQDVRGTIAGNWFFGDASPSSPSGWNDQLAFIRENDDPSMDIISIGGRFTESGVWRFASKNSGTINRKFSETIIGIAYCYEGEDAYNWQGSGNAKQDGKIIVQLIDDITLQIEHQNGSCENNEKLVNPTTYGR